MSPSAFLREKAAKVGVTIAHEKDDGSYRPEMPSVDEDPSQDPVVITTPVPRPPIAFRHDMSDR